MRLVRHVRQKCPFSSAKKWHFRCRSPIRSSVWDILCYEEHPSAYGLWRSCTYSVHQILKNVWSRGGKPGQKVAIRLAVNFAGHLTHYCFWEVERTQFSTEVSVCCGFLLYFLQWIDLHFAQWIEWFDEANWIPVEFNFNLRSRKCEHEMRPAPPLHTGLFSDSHNEIGAASGNPVLTLFTSNQYVTLLLFST